MVSQQVGSEFKGETVNEYSRKEEEEQVQYRLPFGGGSGAGVNINPIAFLVVQTGNVKLLPVNHSSAVDKLLDYMPDAIEKINTLINKQIQVKCDEKSKKEEKKESEGSSAKEKTKEPKSQKQSSATVTKTKPRRGRAARNSETFEYEYNEVPTSDDIIINIDESDEFDD